MSRPVGGGQVKILLDGDKGSSVTLQLLHKLEAVLGVAGEPVQTVADDGLDLAAVYVLHHPLEVGPLRAAAGEALVLVDQGAIRLLLSKAAGDVLTAHLDLVLDALALAGEFGFSGIDRKDLLFWWCTHDSFLFLSY